MANGLFECLSAVFDLSVPWPLSFWHYSFFQLTRGLLDVPIHPFIVRHQSATEYSRQSTLLESEHDAAKHSAER
jgi:hypothetical protein